MNAQKLLPGPLAALLNVPEDGLHHRLEEEGKRTVLTELGRILGARKATALALECREVLPVFAPRIAELEAQLPDLQDRIGAARQALAEKQAERKRQAGKRLEALAVRAEEVARKELDAALLTEKFVQQDLANLAEVERQVKTLAERLEALPQPDLALLADVLSTIPNRKDGKR